MKTKLLSTLVAHVLITLAFTSAARADGFTELISWHGKLIVKSEKFTFGSDVFKKQTVLPRGTYQTVATYSEFNDYGRIENPLIQFKGAVSSSETEFKDLVLFGTEFDQPVLVDDEEFSFSATSKDQPQFEMNAKAVLKSVVNENFKETHRCDLYKDAYYCKPSQPARCEYPYSWMKPPGEISERCCQFQLERMPGRYQTGGVNRKKTIAMVVQFKGKNGEEAELPLEGTSSKTISTWSDDQCSPLK